MKKPFLGLAACGLISAVPAAASTEIMGPFKSQGACVSVMVQMAKVTRKNDLPNLGYFCAEGEDGWYMLSYK